MRNINILYHVTFRILYETKIQGILTKKAWYKEVSWMNERNEWNERNQTSEEK